MTCDFCTVFTCIGVRSTKQADKHFIYNFRTFMNPSKSKRIRFALLQPFIANGRGKNTGCDFDSFRSGNSNTSNSPSLGSGYGTDSILVHDFQFVFIRQR